MEMHTLIILIYLAVVLFVITVFLVKESKQRREIDKRIDNLEREEEDALGRSIFARYIRNRRRR